MVGYVKNIMKEERLKLKYNNYKKQTFEEFKEQHDRSLNFLLVLVTITYVLLICSVCFGINNYVDEQLIERRDLVINTLSKEMCNDKGQEWVTSNLFVDAKELSITCTKETIIKPYK